MPREMPESSARSRVCNVLVIGAGAAGLRAAIAATQAGSQVLVVGKRDRRDAHTVLAAGGINAVLGTRDPQDTWEQHFADTLREGYLLGHPRVVEIMAREAPDAVRELAAWGCRFATLEDGRLDQRFFGAHKYRRTCYAGDYTGRPILYTLASKTQELGIPVIEDQYVRACSLPMASVLAPMGSTSYPASAPSSKPTPSSWRPGATRGCGVAAHRAATRTMARACTWRSRPVAA